MYFVSSKTLIDYHKMFFPPNVIHQTKHARESRYDHESTKYYQLFFFMKGNKISLVYIKLFVV